MTDSIPRMINGQPLHDLGDHQRWGNTFGSIRTRDNGREIDMVIFRTARIDQGHYLAIPNGNKRALYRVVTCRTPIDPGDQHLVTARHEKWPDSAKEASTE